MLPQRDIRHIHASTVGPRFIEDRNRPARQTAGDPCSPPRRKSIADVVHFISTMSEAS